MNDTGTRRFALSDDRWIELGPMTGRDFLRAREVLAHRESATDADVEDIVRIIERRAVASSEEDPLEIPQSEIIEVFFRWYVGVDDAAVPQPTGSSSAAQS